MDKLHSVFSIIMNIAIHKYKAFCIMLCL